VDPRRHRKAFRVSRNEEFRILSLARDAYITGPNGAPWQAPVPRQSCAALCPAELKEASRVPVPQCDRLSCWYVTPRVGGIFAPTLAAIRQANDLRRDTMNADWFACASVESH